MGERGREREGERERGREGGREGGREEGGREGGREGGGGGGGGGVGRDRRLNNKKTVNNFSCIFCACIFYLTHSFRLRFSTVLEYNVIIPSVQETRGREREMLSIG